METVKMKIRNKKSRRKALSVGSALILAVVLTSLLAIIGVLFLMASRVNKIAASAISQTRELDLAVDAVVARIAEELALDVPRVDANGVVLQEYYDYPDEENRWLASLEPYEVGQGAYRWLYLTDLYDVIYDMYPLKRRIDLPVKIVPDYQDPAYVGDSSELRAADADGDGVADSVWAELTNITSGTGRTIYAAVRVIDNLAMINVNTAYKFDPTEGLQRIDGSSQMQINLAGLSLRGDNGTLAQAADKLQLWRCGREPTDLPLYQQNVVWRYNEPSGLYTPFDISDELKLRNRYILNYNWITTRIEELWERAYDGGLSMPRNQRHSISDPCDWFWKANNSSWDANQYDYRHIATTYNMDRIIAPDGERMVNVNMVGQGRAGLLYEVIRAGLIDAGVPDPNSRAAQMAINIVDYRDYNSDVNTIVVDGNTYYGFERPCVYISELAYNSNDVNNRSYAIELYKPYFEDNDPCGWQLVIDNQPNGIDVNWSGTRRFHVVLFEDSSAPLSVYWTREDSRSPVDGATRVDPEVVLAWSDNVEAKEYNLYLGSSFDDVNNADKTSDELIASKLSDNNYPIIGYDPNGLDPETTYYWRVDGVNFVNPSSPWKGDVWRFRTGPNDFDYDPNFQYFPMTAGDPDVFSSGSIIELRRVAENGDPVVVDSVQVSGSLVAGVGTRSYQRDITRHKCIRRLWDDSGTAENSQTLGHGNRYSDPSAAAIQAHPYLDPDIYGNKGFTNIGEIGIVFDCNAYTPAQDPMVYPPDIIGYNNEIEEDVRINLADANYQRIFNYLTVFDPVNDYIDNDGDGFGIDTDGNNILDPCEIDPDELKIPGRININTAPWYVIAQLPWMTPEIAQAIAYYRHTPQGPFRSVGQLSSLADMHIYGNDGEQFEYPDLTPADGAADDLEERDLLFARISNLVTVRSDVFTAYILVRIGPDGPQKRVMAILDRSDVYADGSGGVTGRVRIRALHPVPDPR